VQGAKIVRLSYTLRLDDPLPPAIPPPRLAPLYSLAKGDDANVVALTLANHSGTHVDAPRHVIADGVPITAFAPEELVFERPVVIDLPQDDRAIVGPDELAQRAGAIASADILLVRFGYGPVRAGEPARYRDRCPGFGVQAATYLRERFPGLRAIGMDVPSLSTIASLSETMRAHNILLGGAGRRFLIIEDMNLDQDLSGLGQVWVAPLLVDGFDSAPCTVFGVVA
jgi:kynurenine formamidase